jgi:xylulose-5-phosphate/fructose-6-phosphate phosphoketolase
VLDDAVKAIKQIQTDAREHNKHEKPQWPMIILRTPKGWHSIETLGDKRIEDNCYSHQVIAEEARHNEEHMTKLEAWLRSYNFNELFDGDSFDLEIEALVPELHFKMGDNDHARGGEPHYKPLSLPPLAHYDDKKICNLEDPICGMESSMEKIGAYLRDVMKANEEERNVRLMSPDETYSNKIHAVFEYTKRSFVWPHKPWDRDLAYDGRVLEMLSEHSLQGLLQGYVLTGRHGVFVSYEAFVQIVTSMADQYAKFLKIARDVHWRGTIASLNYILTSTGWRQEHNGFSHQNPGFIDGILQRQGCFTNVYFPADANTALAAFAHMMGSTREINVLVCEKRPLPIWRTLAQAKRDVEEGISIWEFASDEHPDVVFAAAGDYPTLEALAAMSLVREYAPEVQMRFVNITTLSALGIGNSQCRVLRYDFEHYFTKDCPVILNFHGYPQTIKQVLFDYAADARRFTVHGYEETGSTTTPFDMMVRNRVDRFHLAMEALKQAAERGVITKDRANEIITTCKDTLRHHRDYIIEHGDDPVEITNWTWQPRSS